LKYEFENTAYMENTHEKLGIFGKSEINLYGANLL